MLILIPEPKSSLESHPPPLDSREPPPIPRKKATIVFRSKAVGKTDKGTPNQSPVLPYPKSCCWKIPSFQYHQVPLDRNKRSALLTKNEWSEKLHQSGLEKSSSQCSSSKFCSYRKACSYTGTSDHVYKIHIHTLVITLITHFYTLIK